MTLCSINKTSSAVVGCSLALATPSLAQDLVPSAPPQDRPTAIVNATIHTVSDGVIEGGTIIFENGVITLVGDAHLRGEPHERIVDARGKHVYPGLISPATVLGLTEVGSVRDTQDYNELNDVSPEVRAAVSVNPDSWLIPVTRSNGILTAGVTPLGGAIPGRASVIRLDGWTWEDMTIDDAAGLIVNWPTMRNVSAWWMTQTDEEQDKRRKEQTGAINRAFDDAEAYFAAKRADPDTPTDIRYEAMRASLEGEDPIFIRAQELEQIQAAVTWGADRGYRMVLIGGRDAHQVTDLLKRHDVSVIVGGTHRTPRRSDSSYDDPFTLPAKLEAAGVRWCLGSSGGGFGASSERNLPYHAATSVAYGLDPDVAIRSMTLSAAQILGVGDTLGSIEVGKAATLIITDGNPLEITTNVEMAFIDGREIVLDDKQKALNEKYREKYRQIGAIEE